MVSKVDERAEGEEHEYIEDAVASDRDVEADRVLTDEELRCGGLVKIRAYVRTRRSKAALRSRENRERKLDEGIRQLNLQAPANDNVRAMLKDIAKAMCEGTLPAERLAALVRQPDAAEIELKKCRAVLEKGGWRAWFIRRLLP